jgi:hypothetical protein
LAPPAGGTVPRTNGSEQRSTGSDVERDFDAVAPEEIGEVFDGQAYQAGGATYRDAALGDRLRQYLREGQRSERSRRAVLQPTPATSHEVAAWAVRKGLWHPRPADVIAQCAADLADALREEYITDAKGRRVRAKHAARVTKDGKQLSFWADIRTAPRSHMELAFRQRRNQIVGDCKQLKNDVDSYNDANASQPAIPMLFDFTDDLDEAA